MQDNQLYAQYLNSIQVKYITGGYYKATTKWNNTEKVKLNKFYYVVDGEFELTINDKLYTIKKGEIVLIPCDVKHSYKLTSKEHMKKHWCHFEALNGSDNFFKNVKTDLIVNVGIDKNLISMFKKLYTYENNPDAISSISSKATLMLIIAKYLENCKNITIKKNADNPELASVINFMQENISGSITVEKLAQTIASKAPIAVGMAKTVINKGDHVDLHTGCALEAEAFGGCCGTEDQKEGMRAFLEKRPAEFKNR